MVVRFFEWLFNPAGLTPHGFCLLWQPELIVLHAGADIATGLAYFSIPLALAVFAGRRPDLVYRPVAWLFIAFILLCGTTHFVEVATLWIPAYAFHGVVKAATAMVSVGTAVALWLLMPRLLALPSRAQLGEANAALQAANAALVESQAHYRASFAQSPVPMHILDSDGNITDVSESWIELFGYSRADVIGRHVRDFAAPGARHWVDEDRAVLMRKGEIRDVERRFRRADGSVVEALVSCRVERRGAEMGLICVVQDITARRRTEAALHAAEERLRHSNKMEAIGQLTGGMAHDFNNMLQGVGGCLDMMERRIAQGRAQEVSRYLPPARQAIDRAANLTSRMLAFARRQALQPQLVDPDELVRGMEELIRRTIGPGIELTLELHDGAWLIMCDPNQLESAVLNVSINARDAMPAGGHLRIATADHIVGAAEVSALGAVGTAGTAPRGGGGAEMATDDAAPGRYVAISVSDTGSGMSVATMERMFDPFFTTKPIGQGSGLGLSQLYGFVRQSGGFVRVSSTLGQGTTITLYMPRQQDADDASGRDGPGAAAKAMPDPKANGARVLVVDDDAQVRALISEALHDMGCAVLEAADGLAGWQILQSDAALDLLITDVGLPGMNGRQLAEAARAARRGLPVLIITGYAGQSLADLELPARMEVLRKPFSLAELTPRIAGILQRGVGAPA